MKTLTLKDTTFASNLVQGPLAGVSCAPFRERVWEYSTPAFCTTEMISSKTLIHSPRSHKRFVYKAPTEGPLCFQLSANNPDELALATRMVTDSGADLVDLNCGCPVKKIRSKGAGSSLLSRPAEIYQLIRAMKNNTDKPVSVKIRVDARSKDRFNQDIANAINDAEPDFVTVHGRHWSEGYDVDCAYDDIRFFVENLNVPVIGNGDVACIDSLKRMLATGCAGAMIARAGVGQPWLIQQLQTELKDEVYIPPNLGEIAAILWRHLEGLCELLQSEKFAILQMRAMVKYYARTLPDKTAFCEAFNQCERMDKAEALIKGLSSREMSS